MTAEPEASAVRRFFGAALIAVGVLIGGLSGLCSVVFLVALIGSAPGEILRSSPGEALSTLGLVAMIGGPPILVGWLMIWGGKRLRNPRPRIAPDDAAKTF